MVNLSNPLLKSAQNSINKQLLSSAVGFVRIFFYLAYRNLRGERRVV